MKFCLKIFLALVLFNVVNIYGQDSDNLVYVDNNGNLKWTNTNENAYFFGVNYSVPFAFSYKVLKDKGISHKEVIDLDVQQFKRLGMNAYRIHVWDREVSDKDGNLLVNEHIELLDYLIAKLIKNDIYIILTPIAWWGTGWPAPDVETTGFSTFYSKIESTTKPEVLKAHTNYLKQFLKHKNLFTGKTYASEEKIIAYEIFNEPNLPKDVEAIRHYVNTTANVMREEGITKPIFFNISENPDSVCWLGVAASNINGVSFQWYPTGLVNYSELKGNFLPNIINYNIPNFTDKINNKAKMVYEFDAADIGSSIMYPVMANSFRKAGMQWATMFCYDPTPIAQYNSEYSTHYLNLLYTPQKALSFLIASNIFYQNSVEDKNFIDSSLTFNNALVNYQIDLSLINDSQNFIYTNSNNLNPKDINSLTHIAGFGNSKLVKYSGKGSYFLDKIEDDVWKLEVYPDAVWIKDPFGKNGLIEPVAKLIWKDHSFRFKVNNLNHNYYLFNEDSKNIQQADSFIVNIQPGRYFISNSNSINKIKIENSAVDFSLLKKYGSYISDFESIEIKNVTKENTQENQAAKISAEIYSNESDFDVYVYFKRAGWQGYQKEIMTAKNDFTFEYQLTNKQNKNGLLQYFISVEKGKNILTFPGRINLSPNAWNFNRGETYVLKILPEVYEKVIYDPIKDKSNLIVSNIWRFIDYTIDYTYDESKNPELNIFINKIKEKYPELAFQIYVGDQLEDYQLDKNSKIKLQLKNTNNKIKKIQLRLLYNDGSASNSEVNISNQYNPIEISIPKPQAIDYALLPRPYPIFQPYWFSSTQITTENKNIKLESVQIAIQLNQLDADDGIKIKEIKLIKNND